MAVTLMKSAHCLTLASRRGADKAFKRTVHGDLEHKLLTILANGTEIFSRRMNDSHRRVFVF